MAGQLKEVRNRIKSVQSTQQITKAMKMVAAARLRRAQERVINARPYSRMAGDILKNVAAAATSASEIQHPLLAVREEKKVQIVLVTADRGLAGAFNSNIIKAAPWPLRMVLRAIFSVIFKSPARAAEPVIYLAGSADFDGRSNEYLHMFAVKPMDPKVYSTTDGKRLFDESMALWSRIDPQSRNPGSA